MTYLFFQIFTLITARLQTTNPAGRGVVVTPANLLQPVIIYASLGLTSIPNFFFGASGTAVDAAGISWDITNIDETMMTINLFTVVVIAFLAIAKIVRGDVTSAALQT